MRERLIELLTKTFDEQYEKRMLITPQHTSDYLLANGVIVPPVKVGDIFYGINETSYDDYEVLGFKFSRRKGDDEDVLIVLTTYEMEFIWGEEAFPTKEDAENALKERERV